MSPGSLLLRSAVGGGASGNATNSAVLHDLDRPEDASDRSSVLSSAVASQVGNISLRDDINILNYKQLSY